LLRDKGMKKIAIVFLIVVAMHKTCISQNTWEWAKQIIGTNSNVGSDVATDSENNVYVAGTFIDNATFGNQTFTANCQTMCQTGFVVKYAADGSYNWTNVFSTLNSCFAEKILVDHEDNIIVSGRFDGIIWIGSYQLESQSSQDVFVAKINQQGDVLWVKQGICLDNISIESIAVDNSNNIYAAGRTWNQANFDNLNIPDPGLFIVKFNTDGTPLSVINERGCLASSIAVGDDYSLYLSGIIYSTATIGVDTLEPSGYYHIEYLGNDTDSIYVTPSDLLFVRYDSLGNVVWHRTAYSKGYDDAISSTLDNNSNFYITGSIGDTTNFWGTIIPYSYFSNQFLLKIDSAGNVSWVKKSTPISSEGRIYFTDITYKNDSLYLVGFPWGQSLFGGIVFSSPSNQQNTFIAKLNTDGVGDWLEMDTTNLARSEPLAIVLDENNDFIITGYFEDSVHFGEHYLDAFTNGFANMYVAKMRIGPVGIEETSRIDILIFPNPTTTEITVNGYSPAYLKLCNTLGQKVAEANKSNKLYVGNLPQGLYVLQMFDANGQHVKTEKVIVAK
jgi:hypothetical protein